MYYSYIDSGPSARSSPTHFQRFPQKTGVSALNLCRDFRLVRYNSPSVTVRLALLSGNVGAHIPTVRLRKQRGITQFINVFLEPQRSMRRRRKLGDMVLAEVRNRFGDPCTLNSRTGRSDTKRRGSMWTVREEQIWKIVDGQTETVQI